MACTRGETTEETGEAGVHAGVGEAVEGAAAATTPTITTTLERALGHCITGELSEGMESCHLKDVELCIEC